MELNKKNIIITGAGSGIGQALLKNLSVMFECKIIAADLVIDSIKESETVFPISFQH